MMDNPVGKHDLLIVVDFGSQSSQLIARRVREAHVYCELWSYKTDIDKIKAMRPRGVILSGGPRFAADLLQDEAALRLFDLDIPILAVGESMQLLTVISGGSITDLPSHVEEAVSIRFSPESMLGRDITDIQSPKAWVSASTKTSVVPPGFVGVAGTRDIPIMAIENREHDRYGVHFHPELSVSPWGKELLRRFAVDICGATPSWKIADVIEQEVRAIREEVDGYVLCGLSGGIDSSAAAALLHKAIGDRLICVYVDHGFMRQGETEQVIRTFEERFGQNFIHVDAEARFFSHLNGVTDPEQKRKIIGEQFIRVFEEEALRLQDRFGRIEFLVQGTLYPDVIESGVGGDAQLIKSHHNVGGLPKDMNLKLIEPLRSLFKDEVRQLASELGLPEEIVWRQPFPGPGLAIRVMGEPTPERVAIVRAADHIVIEELWNAGLYRDVFQAFAVLSDTRTVGVSGDARTYGYVVSVRAVSSEDGMSADWSRLSHDLLATMSNRIMREVPDVSRVVYDISSKPPATIEWE